MATPMMKQFIVDLTDADVGCPTYECSILVNVGMEQLEDDFELYDLEEETDLIVAITEVYIEFVVRRFNEHNYDGRALIDEDKEARDNAFDGYIADGRNEMFQEECLSGNCHWWEDGIIGAYADKIKCHAFVKLIQYVQQEHENYSGENLSDKTDAEDVFGWAIYFASEYIYLTLEKVWVDDNKYQEGCELRERYNEVVKAKKN